MNTYKITNITHLLAKRDRKANTTLAIEYVDKMTRKTANIKPNDSVYLTVSTLPLSVHRLRIKSLITVSEISPIEVSKAVEKTKPKKAVTPKIKMKKAVSVKVVEEEPVVIAEEKQETVKKGKAAKKE